MVQQGIEGGVKLFGGWESNPTGKRLNSSQWPMLTWLGVWQSPRVGGGEGGNFSA